MDSTEKTENELKIDAICITTKVIREMIIRGECKFVYDDGTEVKPEEYFWDESHFPITVIINKKEVAVKRSDIDIEEYKRALSSKEHDV